jgi:hypothetical protein
MGQTRRQRPLAGGNDRRWRREIRLTHFQMDNIMSGRLQGLRPSEQGHDMKRGNTVVPGGLAKHANQSFCRLSVSIRPAIMRRAFAGVALHG